MNYKRMLTSCFGLGLGPIAPGTWGSIPPAVVFFIMYYYGVSALIGMIVLSIIMLVASFACVRYSGEIVKLKGKEDPGEVVADEVAGQAVTFIPVYFMMSLRENRSFSDWLGDGRMLFIAEIALVGFLLFRVLDITKPWPCKKLEKLPDGWGILADDLMAGIYAGVVLLAYLRFRM